MYSKWDDWDKIKYCWKIAGEVLLIFKNLWYNSTCAGANKLTALYRKWDGWKMHYIISLAADAVHTTTVKGTFKSFMSVILHQKGFEINKTGHIYQLKHEFLCESWQNIRFYEVNDKYS